MMCMFEIVQFGVKCIGGMVDLMLCYGCEGYMCRIELYDVYAAIVDVIEVVVFVIVSDVKVVIVFEGDGIIECEL